jgi:uncharacterized membrane protein SpoIIM required for sporulation
MVLERLIPENIAEKKLTYAFFLGVIYSIIGIVIASLLFPADPSLVAVAFTAILLIPTIRKIYQLEEDELKREKKFSFKALWKDENDFTKFYLLVILGIFLVYAVSALMLPSMSVNGLFRDQLELRGAGVVENISGHASFTGGLFLSLLANNFIVLIACVIMAFLTGDGAIFLLTWNASLWGTIFGVTARNASIISHVSPVLILGLILLIVLPHAFLEMFSYILGAISGGLMSNDVVVEKGESKKDRYQGKYWKTALIIFVIALLVVVLGAAVETFVLDNVSIYAKIIQQSYMFV